MYLLGKTNLFRRARLALGHPKWEAAVELQVAGTGEILLSMTFSVEFSIYKKDQIY